MTKLKKQPIQCNSNLQASVNDEKGYCIYCCTYK